MEVNNKEITTTEDPITVESDLELEKTVYADYPEVVIKWNNFITASFYGYVHLILYLFHHIKEFLDFR